MSWLGGGGVIRLFVQIFTNFELREDSTPAAPSRELREDGHLELRE